MSDALTLHHLRSLHPELVPYVVWFVDAMRAAGVPLDVISGRRTVDRNRAVGGAPRSLHVLGLAFDCQVRGYTRDQVDPQLWRYMGEFWESMGGRWGGRFSVPDVNHFDVGPLVDVES